MRNDYVSYIPLFLALSSAVLITLRPGTINVAFQSPTLADLLSLTADSRHRDERAVGASETLSVTVIELLLLTLPPAFGC